ncbi:hypothetical protein TCON_1625 [Astathelohania contejeani]|uniref:Uncharacterized protein n=1 Tax=Astathelohania contejeani TaxID=164912 RepID=A0ABQ7HYH5_9MICR|nr:hypothetical protein TCON_1625 [Thelohania contejeani]
MGIDKNPYDDYKRYLNKLDELNMFHLKLIYSLFDKIRILCYNITLELENMIQYIKKIKNITSRIYEHNNFKFLFYLTTHNKIPVQLVSIEEEIIKQNHDDKSLIIMTEKSYHHLIAMKHILIHLFKFENDLHYYIYVLYAKLLYINSGMENYTKIFNFCMSNK